MSSALVLNYDHKYFLLECFVMSATMSRTCSSGLFWCVILASQDSGYLCILTVSITEQGKLHFLLFAHAFSPGTNFKDFIDKSLELSLFEILFYFFLVKTEG